MAKTCDIVYVQPHWRGFKKGAYSVIDYWRANGSAYKGGHSPFKARTIRSDELVTRRVGSENIPMVAGCPRVDVPVEAEEFRNQIRGYMNNVTPQVYIKTAYAASVVYSGREEEYKKHDFNVGNWSAIDDMMEELAETSKARGRKKIVYAIDPIHGGYLHDINGKRVPTREAYNGVIHMTPGGSTVCVTPNNKITGIHAAPGDSYTPRTLIAKAITAGGDKVDAYETNHEFMVAAGFVPVAWVPTEPKDYPEGFNPDKEFSCDRILYAHATKCEKEDVELAADLTLSEWKKRVVPNRDMKAAEKRREDYMNGDKGIRYEKTVKAEKEERRQHRRESRWMRPSLDTTLLFSRKKSKEEKEYISNNWADWEDEEFEYDIPDVF